MSEKPYLSIVASSRNDGHGGDILKRMQLFVKGMLHQTKRYNIPAELIIVEWNPPKDKPLLHEVLPKPGADDILTIRYIIVPEEIHNTFVRHKEIPLFQMIAKNVGIRRAKGDFILCTNIDLLFSDELFEVLAKRSLKKDGYYRANRCDVPDQFEFDWDWKKQMDYCSHNIIRRLGMDYRYIYLHNMPEFVYKFHWLAAAINVLAFYKRKVWDDPAANRFRVLDTKACGDFTLAHRDVWMDLQGYVELDLYSIHIDTLGLVGLDSLGYKQYIFTPKACAYHIDHPTGWESMTPIDKLKFVEERPGVGFDLVWDSSMIMLKEPTHFNLNPENWGYADVALKEYAF